MSYATIDYLPDLTFVAMVSAGSLDFVPFPVATTGWDYAAFVSGNDSYALLHDTYRFTAIAGTTFDIFSMSYFDPYVLRIYDQFGNTIAANDEYDDGADIPLSDAYYSQDVIFDWVAPYTGTFYVAANWQQGSYFKYYSLNLYEDLNTAGLGADTTAPFAVTFSPTDEATSVAITANIVVTFSEPIQRGTGSVVLKTASGTVVATYDAATSSNLGISSTTLTINPAVDLAYGTGYVVTLAAGTIKDLAGNTYAGTTTYNFTTSANPANKTFIGTSASESFVSGAGSDSIDGAGGIDSAHYSGIRANYSLTKTASGFTITDTTGRDGTDTLQNVERCKFTDSSIALDVGATQSGGEAALLVGVVLPGLLALDSSKHALIGTVIGLFDAGFSMRDLAGAVLRLPIWDALTGHTSSSSTDITSYLLTNISGHAPDQIVLAAAVNALNTESIRGDWLARLAVSAESQTHIGLVGLGETGLVYM